MVLSFSHMSGGMILTAVRFQYINEKRRILNAANVSQSWHIEVECKVAA